MKKFTKLLKEKRWRWTAGGVMCLVLAVMIFALSSGGNASAAATTISELERANGKITEASEFELLRNAQIESGMTYTLENDITIDSITSVANGNFAGTFDGNGHVITINNIDITEGDVKAIKDSQISGLLFGKVQGNVRNVIIDIKDNDASYVRNTSNEITNSISEEPDYENTRILNDNDDIHELTEDELIDNVTYKKQSNVSVNGIRTTNNTAESNPATDYFGLICGENAGTIEQVYVTGNAVSVSRTIPDSVNYFKFKQPGTTIATYYYKQSEKLTTSTENITLTESEKQMTFEKIGLSATLTKEESSSDGTGTANYNYTLTLSNINSVDVNSRIQSKTISISGLDGWTDDVTVVAGNTIELKKTSGELENVTFTATLTTTEYTYSYEARKTTYGEFSAFTDKGTAEDPIPEKQLYAGGIAGLNTGTISQVKQSVDLDGTVVKDEFMIGGIAGSASAGTLSDLYMLGEVNDVSGVYVGTGSITPSGSASSPQATAPNDAPAWITYERYVKKDTAITAETHAELKWLVKGVEFNYAEPENNAVAVSLDNKITNGSLQHAIVYVARKDMNATSEKIAHFSDQPSINLGDSGFYGLLSMYATDGYYHYIEETGYNEENDHLTIRYPYLNENEEPLTIDAENSKVIRSKMDPLEDKVQLQLTHVKTGKIYYIANDMNTLPTASSSSVDISSTGTVDLPFQTENVQYHMVAVVGGHIYPAFVSDEYTKDARASLPKPQVNVFDYYNEAGEKNSYRSFRANASYIAGKDMIIHPYGTETSNYSFRYLFSAVAPVTGNWDDKDLTNDEYRNRYIGDKNAFENTYGKLLDYTDSAVIPADFIGKNKYLYVEVSRKNYNPEIYYYGPFTVNKADILTPVVPSGDGYSVINGDVMKIEGAPDGVQIQYYVSKTPLSNDSSVNWNTYAPAQGIGMNEETGSYVYVRIRYSDSKYSEAFEFACAFGGECAEPGITPHTGAPSENGDQELDRINASLIDATDVLTLSSRTENANIFYIISEQKQTISFVRAEEVPDGTEDGKIIGNKKYFKVENRWYSTENTATERYNSDSGIYLENETKDRKLSYISAVAVADGYKISKVRNYVYLIMPAQQVVNPEAAIETFFTPNESEEKIEVANVALGANISFYSVTPEAEIYYATGSETAVPEIKMDKSGVTVEGNYGDRFVVRVQARKAGMLPSEVITFIYQISDQEVVSVPTATPGTSDDMPTTIVPGNKILLSTTTKEASIYYTLDGSSPIVTIGDDGIIRTGSDATKPYDPSVGIDMPEDGKDYFTITAIAVKNGLANSPEAHFTYSYPSDVLAPYANFASGKVDLNAVVFLKNLTEDAVIYYNVAYGENVPDDPTISSSVFNEEYPFTITQKTTIKAMAAKDGVKSEIVTFVFEPMAQLKAPAASIASGSVVARGTVLELKSENGATVYYTMDGSDPLDSTNTAVMSGNSLVLNGEAGGQIAIKAYAMANNMSRSEVVTFTYLFSQNTGGVTASIESGSTVANGTKVNLISDVTDGDIYYTTDGSSPVSKGIKGTTVEIDGEPGTTVTVKAVVIVNGEPGIVATFMYRIQERPNAPAASPAGGTLTVATRVTLSSDVEKIYYTTDGSEPTKSSSLYSEPILINRATTLKAIAVSEEGVISDVATYVYEAALKAASVVSSSKDGEVLEPGDQISLTSSTDGAVIYYSTDGTEPTVDNLDNLLIYDGDFIEINRSVTIRAVAYREDLRLSDVQTWSYIVETIPAVEQKEAEAAKLAEEGLQDTDASELVRHSDAKTDKTVKIVQERTCKTALLYSEDALNGVISLETEKEENNPYAVKKAKGIYGDDTTVLESYKVKVKSGSNGVQPKESVELVFPIPKGYEDAALSVAFVKDDYNLTTLETRREADVLYVTTQKVGSYVIIGPEKAQEDMHQFPYLLILEVAAGITLFGGAIYCAKEKIKKIKKNK